MRCDVDEWVIRVNWSAAYGDDRLIFCRLLNVMEYAWFKTIIHYSRCGIVWKKVRSRWLRETLKYNLLYYFRLNVRNWFVIIIGNHSVSLNSTVSRLLTRHTLQYKWSSLRFETAAVHANVKPFIYLLIDENNKRNEWGTSSMMFCC